MTVYAADTWRNNAELIKDVASLGYLQKDWITLDPTWGRGTWWRLWTPTHLVCHDLYKLDGVDFRKLPELDASFDAVAFDPPYVSPGGRATTTIPEFHDAYGTDLVPATPAQTQELINDGITEMHRVLKPRGILLVKCMNYISSGNLWIGTHHTLAHALSLGFEPIDWFEHLGHGRAQPGGRRQVHARRNLSTLFVFRRGTEPYEGNQSEYVHLEVAA